MKFCLLATLILSLSIFGCNNYSGLKQQQVETFASNLYGGTGGLSVDKTGNVYSSDFGPFLGAVQNLLPQCKIFKITPAGIVTVFADSIKGASGSHFDKQENLYQSNIISKEITRITPDGIKTTITADSLFSPVGVYC